MGACIMATISNQYSAYVFTYSTHLTHLLAYAVTALNSLTPVPCSLQVLGAAGWSSNRVCMRGWTVTSHFILFKWRCVACRSLFAYFDGRANSVDAASANRHQTALAKGAHTTGTGTELSHSQGGGDPIKGITHARACLQVYGFSDGVFTIVATLLTFNIPVGQCAWFVWLFDENQCVRRSPTRARCLSLNGGLYLDVSVRDTAISFVGHRFLLSAAQRTHRCVKRWRVTVGVCDVCVCVCLTVGYMWYAVSLRCRYSLTSVIVTRKTMQLRRAQNHIGNLCWRCASSQLNPKISNSRSTKHLQKECVNVFLHHNAQSFKDVKCIWHEPTRCAETHMGCGKVVSHVPVCLEGTWLGEAVSQYMYTSWTYVVNVIPKYTFVTIPEQKMPDTGPRKYLSNETNMSSSPHITVDHDCMIVRYDSKSTPTLTLDLQVLR